MPKRFEWERGFDRNLILGHLRKVRKPGGRAFEATGYAFWLPVLNSAIRTNGFAYPLKERCISTSLSDPSLDLKDTDAFLESCERQYERLAQRPKSNFILYTTVTYSGPKLLDWIAEGDARIYWQPSPDGDLMKKVKRAQAAQEFQRKVHKISEGDALCPILVRLTAYDAFDAFEKANDCIDRFRGLLNLLINSGNAVSPFAKLAAPHAVNRFRRGPFHSVHNPDGSLATETFWYEPRWAHTAPSVNFSDPPDYRRSIQRWWHTLQRNPMREFISDTLLRYCRALDLHEADAALLGIWQVLERLMGTDKYDLLINRLVRIFRDHEDARLIASHIRLRRNQTVHSAHHISHEANAILVQAETLASQAIFFYLKYAPEFEELTDVHHFLDLTLDQAKLKREQRLSQFFIQYQNRT